MFWKTKKSAKSTGIGISIGRQPENWLNGVIPCDWSSFMYSACIFSGFALYFVCSACSSGWIRCMRRLLRIALWLSGQRMQPDGDAEDHQHPAVVQLEGVVHPEQDAHHERRERLHDRCA